MLRKKDIKDIAILKEKNIRRKWDIAKQSWFFSVADFIGIIVKVPDPQAYWMLLRERVRKDERVDLLKLCKKIEINGDLIDGATLKNLLRIVQSINSPKAEPFKRWLARNGREKIENTANPEELVRQAIGFYVKKGYSADWAGLRVRSIATRKLLTGEWRKRGIIESDQFSTLTDDITRAWSGLSIARYKKIKRSGGKNLRNHMTSLELILNMLAETSAVEISKSKHPRTFDEIRQTAKKGGRIAGVARRKLEKQLSRPVIGDNRNHKIKGT